jgi:hypothetical protein
VPTAGFSPSPGFVRPDDRAEASGRTSLPGRFDDPPLTLCLPLAFGGPARLPIPPSLRRLPSSLVPRSSVQAAPRPSGALML